MKVEQVTKWLNPYADVKRKRTFNFKFEKLSQRKEKMLCARNLCLILFVANEA